MAIPPDRLRVVLHQSQSADNLGSVARAMANFGYTDLVLSDTFIEDVTAARRLGVHAESVLDGLTSLPGLDEALAPTVLALGTTSRDMVRSNRPVLSPEEGLQRLSEAAQSGKVALVLGGEMRGLSDAELERCQLVVQIPTFEPQPSMNLSHAAAVMLYLARFAPWATKVAATGSDEGGDSSVPVEPGSERPPLALVQALEKTMLETLLASGFLNPQAPSHVLGELMRTLTRSGLSMRETQLWLSAIKQLARR